MQKSNDEVHWKRTTNLMLAHLFIWFFFGYIIHMFVNQLNTDHRSDPRIPARLLHGRARLADRVRGHAVRVRVAAGQNRPPARRRRRRLRGGQIMATQTGRTADFIRNLGRLYGLYTGGLPRLHRPARDHRAGRCAEQDPRLLVRVLHAGGLRRHRRGDAHGAGVRILRRRTRRAGLLQRHGDRRRLDVGGLLRRHGRLRCSCSATTASPGCSAGPAASCWCRSWSDRTCASSAPIPCPTSWRSDTAATSRASSP